MHTELSDVAEALLRLGGDARSSQNERSTPKASALSLVPGRLVWGKVEGHDWWPAKVVRRRSVPIEVCCSSRSCASVAVSVLLQVGPPPGRAGEVMSHIPVVFFTQNGVPKEVELSMDNEEFPITICQRACGLMGLFSIPECGF